MVQPPRKTVYTNNKISEKERDKTITFTIASKQENIRDKFIEEMKDLYAENYKTDERN